MFKRSNKMAALLISAASVISLVPATGVKADDVIKVDTKEGTIYNAYAHSDGKAYIDGEIIDNKDATYYISDGEYTPLDYIDSGDEISKYEGKTTYLDVDDGDYYIDLDSGTVTEGDIIEDTIDDIAAALRENIKDDTEDRYDEDDANEIRDEDNLKLIGNGWYSTTYDSADEDANGGADKLNVCTDTDGNYIDADYNLGKIKVKTTGGSVNIENTNDKYDLDSEDDAVYATVKQEKIIKQDQDNIYRLVTVTINSSASIEEINGIDLSDISSESVFDGADTNTVSYRAIQKISKEAAADKIDGANYAKTVTTYTLSDEDGVEVEGFDIDFTNKVMKYCILNDNIIAYYSSGNKLYTRAYSLKSSNGYYYTDEGDLSTEDVETDDDGNAAVGGKLFRLDGGYIYQFDGVDDWNKIYKVDGSFNELSIKDKSNFIAWNEDDGVYCIVGGTSAKTKMGNKNTDTTATTTDTTTAATTMKTGWVQATEGTWTYVKEDGTKANGWLNSNNTWYYLKADGVMATGWIKDGSTWYYLKTNGAMAKGWLNDNGKWYYLNESGAMLSNTTVDGYVLDASGVMVG